VFLSPSPSSLPPLFAITVPLTPLAVILVARPRYLLALHVLPGPAIRIPAASF
jgi:hypothetical protein